MFGDFLDNPIGSVLDAGEELVDGVIELTSQATETATDVLGSLSHGEMPSHKQVARCLDLGLDAYAIASLTGCAEDTIQDLVVEVISLSLEG